jgi:hypothetical protein
VEPKSGSDFFIADTGNHAVRKVKDGFIKTEAGDGSPAFAGDGGDPESASLHSPTDILEDGDGLLVADSANNRIRLIGQVGSDTSGGGLIQLPSLGNGGEPRLPDSEPPKLGKHVKVDHQGGKVRVKLPNTGLYIALEHGASIPMGSVVDATRGSVTVTSAHDAKGTPQSATFRGGAFRIEQKVSRKPVTDLIMRGGDFSSCWHRAASSRAGEARASAARARRVRHLWGSGHGRFRTRGRHGAATVRGTIWLTEDSCAGTRVTVRRGLVAVRDFPLRRTVMVPKGHSYLSRSHPLPNRAR